MSYRLFLRAVISVAAGVPLLLAGCERKADGQAAPVEHSVPVVLQPARVMPVQRGVEIVGTLWGDEDTTLAAKVAGRITAIHRDVGDRVEAGEVLADVCRRDYELAQRQKQLAAREPLSRLGLSELPGAEFDAAMVPTVRRARLQADNAEAKYQRGRQLHEQVPPLISEQDYADLRTAWEVARVNYEVELLTAQATLAMARSMHADLDLSSQRLADTIIRAPDSAGPRSYAVAARMVSVGEYVKDGAPVFRLVDDRQVKLRAAVPERYAGEIQLGQEVHLNVESSGETFVGRLSRINPQVDTASRAFGIEVLVPNDKRLLKPGAFARGRVLTRRDERVVFVPQEAVVTFVGVNKVFTIEDGKAIEHRVELGARHGDYVEAKGDLRGDEQLVTEGTSKLATGVRVTVRTPN